MVYLYQGCLTHCLQQRQKLHLLAVGLPEEHTLPYLRLFRCHERLDGDVGLIGSRQQHAERLDATHLAGLEVAQHQDTSIQHLLQRYVLHKAGYDCARLLLSDVDFLNIQAAEK